MADGYDEAPPLPREPTALNVSDAMGNPNEPSTAETTTPPISDTLPPPPKFPSLSDVDLAAAKAAAEAQGIPQQPPVETSAVSSATTDNPTQPLTDTQPVESLTDSTSALHEDIDAAIQRASVAPGTGERKVIEIGQRLWTPTDQEELNRLLAEGFDVFEGGVDTAPDTRTMADRIAIWNQGVAAVTGAAVGAAAGEAAGEATPAEQVGDIQEASPISDTTRDITTGESTTKPAVPTVRSNADVSRSIFGGKFKTVPVISKKAVPGQTTLIGETADEAAKTVEVMLRSDASANVNIKDDYGLKDGHTVGCNDAVFLDENTLVTCGADGKVCIWDMRDRSVSKEFVPYGGEAVTMVHPMTDDDDGHSHTLMTLSQSRLMRIWTVDDKQAVMLRSTQIQSSEKDLYMSVPVISKELKIRAAAAAAAAAVRTTDAPEAPVEVGTATQETAPTAAPPAAETATAAAAAPAPKVEEKERKKFSFTKVLSFGRSSTRKAVAS